MMSAHLGAEGILLALSDGMGWLISLVVLVSAADHWTTYLCLRAPVSGWIVTEANPVADWLFGQFGLVEGLLIDSLITLAALLVLYRTNRVPHAAKCAFLTAVAMGTGYAVLNNLGAIHQLGLGTLVAGG